MATKRAETRVANSDRSVDDTLVSLGARLRDLRRKRNLTLEELAAETGLSASMLSMVERGKASPSIGSLVAVASALGVHMSALFGRDDASTGKPVNRLVDQPVIETSEGVMRRLAVVDDVQDVEIVINEYPAGTASATRPLHHPGHEYGVVLKGTLTVEFRDATYELKRGDAISYSSQRPHRLRNATDSRVKALWINIERH